MNQFFFKSKQVGRFVVFLSKPYARSLQQRHLLPANLASGIARLLQRIEHDVLGSRGRVDILLDERAQSTLGDVRAVGRVAVVVAHLHDVRGVCFRHDDAATAHARAHPASLARLLAVLLAERVPVIREHRVADAHVALALRQAGQTLLVHLRKAEGERELRHVIRVELKNVNKLVLGGTILAVFKLFSEVYT